MVWEAHIRIIKWRGLSSQLGNLFIFMSPARVKLSFKAMVEDVNKILKRHRKSLELRSVSLHYHWVSWLSRAFLSKLKFWPRVMSLNVSLFSLIASVLECWNSWIISDERWWNSNFYHKFHKFNERWKQIFLFYSHYSHLVWKCFSFSNKSFYIIE